MIRLRFIFISVNLPVGFFRVAASVASAAFTAAVRTSELSVASEASHDMSQPITIGSLDEISTIHMSTQRFAIFRSSSLRKSVELEYVPLLKNQLG